ncbi:MAG: hypothetical protein ACRCZP_11625 [Phycicoccus sp.]
MPASTWFGVAVLLAVVGFNTSVRATFIVAGAVALWVAVNATREGRRSAGAAAFLWVSRSRRRAYTVTSAVLAVVATATGVQLEQTRRDVVESAWSVQRRLAEQAAAQRPGEPPVDVSAQRQADEDATTPSSTSTSARGGVDDAAKVTRRQKTAATATARRFIIHWLNGPRAKSTPRWMIGFQGITTSDIRPLLASSRKAIPRTTLSGTLSAKVSTDAADITCRLGDRSSIIVGLTWDAQDRRWRVVDYQPGPPQQAEQAVTP